MKKAFAWMTLLAMLLTLCACGGEKAAEEDAFPIERYEEYARGTTGTYTFEAAQHIERIAVLLPEDMGTLLTEQAGEQSYMGLESAQALVADYSGTDHHIYLVDGKNEVLYSMSSDEKLEPETVADEAPVEKPQKSLAELRQEYAQLSVNLDVYDQGLSEPLPEELSALTQFGDGYFLELDYLTLERAHPSLKTRADEYLVPLYECGLYMAQREATDGMSDAQVAFLYKLQMDRRDLQRGLLETNEKLALAEAPALAPLEEHAALIDQIKEEAGDGYLDDIRYYQLCLGNEALLKYASYLRTVFAQDEILALYDDALTRPQDQAAILLDCATAKTANFAEQDRCRIVLAAALTEQESFRESHAQTIADYESAAQVIIDRHDGKAHEYEVDIDYLKLKIVNESLLEGLAYRETSVSDAETALQAALDEASEIEKTHATKLETLIQSQEKAEQELRLREFLRAQAEALLLDDEGAYSDEALVLDGWKEMTELFIEEMDAARKLKSAGATSTPSSSYSGGGSSSYSSGGSSSYSSGGSSSSKTDTGGQQSFEDYLKENDPDSYEFYKGLEKGLESGTWDPENGFYQP